MDTMAAERPDEPLFPAPSCGIPAEERQRLAECLHTAFGLARGGASSLGYQRLRAGRERALTAAQQVEWGPELVRLWEAGLRWYERFAPPPL
jgi:hypothetical protein